MRQTLIWVLGVVGWGMTFVGCGPTLTEAIKKSKSQSELKKQIGAYCKAKHSSKKTSTVDSRGFNHCVKELSRKHCWYQGGRWHQFTSGCTNRCSYEIARRSGRRLTCTMNMPQECLCPRDQCWTGSHCKPLPMKKIRAALDRRQQHNELIQNILVSLNTCKSMQGGMVRKGLSKRKGVTEYLRCMLGATFKIKAMLKPKPSYLARLVCYNESSIKLKAWMQKNGLLAKKGAKKGSKLSSKVDTKELLKRSKRWERQIGSCMPDPTQPPK